MKNRLALIGVVILLGLAACSSATPSTPGNMPTPTLSDIFSGNSATQVPASTPSGAQSGVPTLSALFDGTPLPATLNAAPRVTGAPTIAAIFRSDVFTLTIATPDRSQAPTVAPVMRPITSATPMPFPPRTFTNPGAASTLKPTPRADLTELVVFDEALNPNWSLDNSKGIKFDAKSATRVKNGKVAIAATPQEDFGTLYWTVRQDAKQNYPRNRVWGVSVWINGDSGIGPEDLALTIVGSNQNPYWVAEDKSVRIDDKHFFSETRLYYLGITREVPANTWIELVVQIDKLPYDPEYQYVTGIYLKNEKGFLKTYYVDRVTLLMNK